MRAAALLAWLSLAAEPDTSPRDAIRDVMSLQVIPRVRACFERDLAREKDLAGKLVVSGRVQGGVLVEHGLAEDALGSAPVAACALTAMRDARWADVPDVAFNYPFMMSARPRTVAVLPFENLSRDPALDWLRAGMVDALVAKLQRLKSVSVAERARLRDVLAEHALAQQGGVDAAGTPRMGEMLGAQVLVLGSFQVMGTRMRITARAVGAERADVRGTAEVTGAVDDVFDLQDALAAQLMEKLDVGADPDVQAAVRARVARSRPVMELMGRAGNALTGTGAPVDLPLAESLYRQVLTMDDAVVEAHLGLGLALLRGPRGDAPEALEEARRHADTATSMRPDDMDATLLAGFVATRQGRHDDALAWQRRAVTLRPDHADTLHALGMALVNRDRAVEGLPLVRSAAELAGGGDVAADHAQLLAWVVGDMPGALEWSRRGTTGHASEWNFVMLALVQLRTGDAAACLRSLEEGRAHRATTRPAHVSLAGYTQAACLVRAGRKRDARAMLATLPADRHPSRIPAHAPVTLRAAAQHLVDVLKPVGARGQR